MTPDPVSPDETDRLPRPSGRAIALGVVGVLVAGVAVVGLGFLGAAAPTTVTPRADRTDTQSGQLGTLPLHDEKPMRELGKGVPGVTPTP